MPVCGIQPAATWRRAAAGFPDLWDHPVPDGRLITKGIRTRPCLCLESIETGAVIGPMQRVNQHQDETSSPEQQGPSVQPKYLHQTTTRAACMLTLTNLHLSTMSEYENNGILDTNASFSYIWKATGDAMTMRNSERIQSGPDFLR